MLITSNLFSTLDKSDIVIVKEKIEKCQLRWLGQDEKLENQNNMIPNPGCPKKYMGHWEGLGKARWKKLELGVQCWKGKEKEEVTVVKTN